MRNSSFLVALGVSLCWLVTGSLAIRVNRTAPISAKSKPADSSERDLQNERNRRLIPYSTYELSNSNEQTNSIQSNPSAEDTISLVTKPTPRPLLTTAKPTHFVYTENFNRDSSRYSYIPIAYIPGARGINYQPDANYYQQSALDKNPLYGDDSATKLYTTASPLYTTSTQPSADKKAQFAYFGDYLTQRGANSAGLLSYLNAPLPKTVLKQTYIAPSPKTPILFSTPQTDYLDFRYSDLYKTQAPKYDPTTTPPTVEITSPKHYTIGNAAAYASYTGAPSGSAAAYAVAPSGGAQSGAASANRPTTSAYQLPFSYPAEVAHFAYSAPRTKLQARPIVVTKTTAEQATQPTKTLMTIAKSQELRYASDRPEYDVQYVQRPYASAIVAPEFTVDDVFKGYNLNKQLPDRITPDNLKDSIKTLSYILQILQKADSITQFQPQPTNDYTDNILDSLKDAVPLPSPEEHHKAVNSLQSADVAYEPYDPKTSIFQEKPHKDDQSTPGRAGIDYPTLAVIPETSFSCKTQRYKGFFADPETKCQVWHYCDLNGGQASFLCPNGTIFNQAALTCDWWFNVKCASTAQLYVLNERLYKYIIPMRPSFPEDYSGPLVDQYLTEKFKEIESKRKYRYPSNSTTVRTEPSSTMNMTAAFSEYEIPAHLLNENL